MDEHETIIDWSNQDAAFVAKEPKLPGGMAHGSAHAPEERD